jgi:hypothetical protein
LQPKNRCDESKKKEALCVTLLWFAQYMRKQVIVM